MKKFFKALFEMLKEDGLPSLNRFESAIGFIAFIVGSGYLIYNNIEWGNYDTFAMVTGGGSTAVAIGNKYINSKYNTKQGEVGKPLSTTTNTKYTSGINGSSPKI